MAEETHDVVENTLPPADVPVAKSSAEEADTTPEMDLDTAHKVLQAVVDTPEYYLPHNQPFESMGGYSLDQIRQSLRIVAVDILDRDHYGIYIPGDPNASDELSRHDIRSTEKYTDQGRLILTFPHDQDLLRMQLFGGEQGNGFRVEAQFGLSKPTTEAGYDTKFDDYSFKDYRQGQRQGAKINTFDEEPMHEGLQGIMLGLRWASANLLDWRDPITGELSKKTIMPEDLPRKLKEKRHSGRPPMEPRTGDTSGPGEHY